MEALSRLFGTHTYFFYGLTHCSAATTHCILIYTYAKEGGGHILLKPHFIDFETLGPNFFPLR